MRWTDPQGIEQVGTVELDRYVPAGTPVALRVGPTGMLRTQPRAGSSATAVIVGPWTVIIGWALLRALVERLAVSYNCRRWAAEWRNVEPVWSGRCRRV